MRIHTDIEGLKPIPGAVVTVGSFDGVHAGHRALLECVESGAAELGGRSVVVTFSPHPRTVLSGGGDIRILSAMPEKALLLERAGIDDMVVIPFTEEFSRLSSGEFVERFIVGKLGACRLVVGFNHRFGHDKEGNAESLARSGRRLGFDITEFSRRTVDGFKVSSTVIRRLISEGKMQEAARLLGHPYLCIFTRRDGLLFTRDDYKLLPPPGRYPVTVSGGGKVRTDTFVSGPGGEPALEGILQYGASEELTVEF